MNQQEAHPLKSIISIDRSFASKVMAKYSWTFQMGKKAVIEHKEGEQAKPSEAVFKPQIYIQQVIKPLHLNIILQHLSFSQLPVYKQQLLVTPEQLAERKGYIHVHSLTQHNKKAELKAPQETASHVLSTSVQLEKPLLNLEAKQQAQDVTIYQTQIERYKQEDKRFTNIQQHIVQEKRQKALLLQLMHYFSEDKLLTQLLSTKQQYVHHLEQQLQHINVSKTIIQQHEHELLSNQQLDSDHISNHHTTSLHQTTSHTVKHEKHINTSEVSMHHMNNNVTSAIQNVHNNVSTINQLSTSHTQNSNQQHDNHTHSFINAKSTTIPNQQKVKFVWHERASQPSQITGPQHIASQDSKQIIDSQVVEKNIAINEKAASPINIEHKQVLRALSIKNLLHINQPKLIKLSAAQLTVIKTNKERILSESEVQQNVIIKQLVQNSLTTHIEHQAEHEHMRKEHEQQSDTVKRKRGRPKKNSPAEQEQALNKQGQALHGQALHGQALHEQALHEQAFQAHSQDLHTQEQILKNKTQGLLESESERATVKVIQTEPAHIVHKQQAETVRQAQLSSANEEAAATLSQADHAQLIKKAESQLINELTHIASQQDIADDNAATRLEKEASVTKLVEATIQHEYEEPVSLTHSIINRETWQKNEAIVKDKAKQPHVHMISSISPTHAFIKKQYAKLGEQKVHIRAQSNKWFVKQSSEQQPTEPTVIAAKQVSIMTKQQADMVHSQDNRTPILQQFKKDAETLIQHHQPLINSQAIQTISTLATLKPTLKQLNVLNVLNVLNKSSNLVKGLAINEIQKKTDHVSKLLQYKVDDKATSNQEASHAPTSEAVTGMVSREASAVVKSNVMLHLKEQHTVQTTQVTKQVKKLEQHIKQLEQQVEQQTEQLKNSTQTINIKQLSNSIYDELSRRIKFEKQRLGR